MIKGELETMININKNRPKNFRHFNPFLAGVLGIVGMLLF